MYPSNDTIIKNVQNVSYLKTCYCYITLKCIVENIQHTTTKQI